MPRLRHFDHEDTARFVTFNCYRNLKALDSYDAKQILVKRINEIRSKHDFKLLGYVIMPNHVHLVIHPPNGMPLGRVVGQIKSLTARDWFSRSNIEPNHRRVFWQKRCYDHNCRTNKAVREKIEYCHNNPVTAGLAKEPGEWTWSSYNWYLGVRDVPIAIDSVEV